MNRILANAAAVSLACAAVSTFALGFGRARVVSVMGQPFEASVALRLEAGEELQPQCVSAQVFYADTLQPAERVSAQVEPGEPPRVQVRSLAPVDEPVVSVYVTVGCTSRLTRKWVSFADPPMGNVEPAYAAAPAPGGPLATLPPAGAGDAVAAAGRDAAQGAAGAGGHTLAAAAGPGAKAVSPGAAEAAAQPQARARNAPVRTAGQPTAARRQAQRKPPARRPTALAAAAAAPAQRSRLQLDVLDVPALQVPSLRLSTEVAAGPREDGGETRAAAAALWRAMNSSPEDLLRDRQRLAELEEGFERLRGDIAESRQAVSRLEARLRQPPAGSMANPWVAMLGVLAAGLAVALAWMAWQRRRDQQLVGEWQAQAQEQEAMHSTLSPAGGVVLQSGPAGLAAPPAAGSGEEPVAAAAPAMERRGTVPAPAGAAAAPAPAAADGGPSSSGAFSVREVPHDDSMGFAAAPPPPAVAAPGMGPGRPRRAAAAPARPMSVEELIDLEQQAEFFTVLGQDEAAIDLLLAHLRSPLATSPLPYLKLLDLYQRRGDPVEYEGVRKQFNARFKVAAPPWDEDLAQGRRLDDYPSVMGRLQRLWTLPSLALEVLQSALLGHDETARPLALPAYRELLLLYAVARDLAEHDEGGVDVLLPLDDPAAPGAEGAAPASGSGPASASAPASAFAPFGVTGAAAVRRREPAPAAAPAVAEAATASAPTPEDALSFEAMNIFINSRPDRRAR
jgi:pilus assembly protein FimV